VDKVLDEARNNTKALTQKVNLLICAGLGISQLQMEVEQSLISRLLYSLTLLGRGVINNAGFLFRTKLASHLSPSRQRLAGE
jgi:hypothetical protein